VKILILGGGISGLSAAWYLRKKHPKANIALLEKSESLGGFLQTREKDGSLFEMGPRTFVVSRSPSLLRLIEEVGLKDELLFSDPNASQRFLWHQGSLRPVKAFMGMALPGLIREFFISKKICEDESIYAYAKRRLNCKIGETLLDPVTLGIYAGDIRKLSLRSCFPFLYDLEQKGHSLLRAILTRGKKDGRLFTLERGLASLICSMQKQMGIEIAFNCPVSGISKEGVVAGNGFWEADQIISALPGPVLGKITKSWENFPTRSIWVVNVGFKEDVLKRKGFGYLSPTKEQEQVLGMVWDSSIFPRRGGSYQTIITAMVRVSKNQRVEDEVIHALQKHLGCVDKPDLLEAHLAEEAIPQFEIGYAKRLAEMTAALKEKCPKLSLIGNYIEGVSVDACIRQARTLI
jgi:oxygen-dependent protoporphyrinogen oxidase